MNTAPIFTRRPLALDINGVVNRSSELLGRWGELSAVSSAAFRTHEGNVPQVNAQFYTNSTTHSWFSYNARMFASLANYRRHLGHRK